MTGLDNGCKGVHQDGKGDHNLTSYDFQFLLTEPKNFITCLIPQINIASSCVVDMTKKGWTMHCSW